MSRSVVLELLQALKLKSPLPDTNLLLLVQVSPCCIRKTAHDLARVGGEGAGNGGLGYVPEAKACVRRQGSGSLMFILSLTLLLKEE